jgi:LmbE family N-acetylglucosaminyl deacetylase
MATIVFFHAHPDDESMATAGTMAKLSADGHRVVLVTATDGAEGEHPEGFLAEGENLADRRRLELEESAKVLGVARLEMLGYPDSGMMGTPANDNPDCFWRADVGEAAARLAAILEEERPDAFTCYDENGNYGHPDHIQVHRVGVAASETAGVPRRYMATINRDRVIALIAMAREAGMDLGGVDAEAGEIDFDTFGVPESRITTEIDVSGFLAEKRRSMESHPSQIQGEGFPLGMPDEAFGLAFGREFYVRIGAERSEPLEDSLI